MQYINENSPLNIPGAGVPAAGSATDCIGELPHRVLPWALAILWLLQLLT